MHPDYGGDMGYPPGIRLIAFLRADDYGIADWRGAVWGSGFYVIMDDAAKEHFHVPTLTKARAAAGGPRNPCPNHPTSRSPDEGRDDARFGRMSWKVVPAWGEELTSMVPPCARATCQAM